MLWWEWLIVIVCIGLVLAINFSDNHCPTDMMYPCPWEEKDND